MRPFKTFFSLFIYPQKSFCYLREKEQGNLNIPFEKGLWNNPPEEMGINEAIMVAWPFIFLDCFKNLLIFLLGVTAYQKLIIPSYPIFEELLGRGDKLFLVIIGYQMLIMTFFPLLTHIKLIIFRWLILIGKKLENKKSERSADLTLISTLVSYIYLPIPLVGGVLQKFLSLFYFYLGMVYHLGYRRRVAIIVASIPFLFYLSFYLRVLLLLRG